MLESEQLVLITAVIVHTIQLFSEKQQRQTMEDSHSVTMPVTGLVLSGPLLTADNQSLIK